ncbi:MAG: cupin domain-containing protein [Woeseia sp.]
MKAFTLTSLLLVIAWAANAGEDDFVRMTPDDLVWTELEPGLDMAILEGDPRSEGYYIMRARFAPGTFSAPHFHPNTRYVTVIKGTWYTGTGTVWDKENSVPLGPGSYMKHPAKAAHFDGAKDEEVIVEIRGMGPAPLVYVDADGHPVE